MIPAERYSRIIDLVNERRFISLNEISESLNIPKSTLRRDVQELELGGHLIRSRGGVSLVGEDSTLHNVSHEASVHIRKSKCQEEKARIARAAMKYVNPNDTIFLDSGTTTYELARELSTYDQYLMVASNDLSSALLMSENDKLELVVIGGKVRKHNYSMTGYFSDFIITQMHADTAFISTDAVDGRKGIMAFSLDEVTGKKAMINGAHQVILLCDHTKFSRIAFVTISELEKIDRLITGKEVDSTALRPFYELGIEVDLV